MDHCKQLIISPMPPSLKASLLGHTTALYQQRTEFFLSYGKPDTSLSTEQYKQYIKKYGMPRPVGFWQLTDDLRHLVQEWLKGTEYYDAEWRIQFVKGGSSIAPHKDLTSKRTHNIVYVLQSGGKGVETAWWRTKDGSSVPETTVVPFEMLELVESCILKDDAFYELDVSTIHSVSKFKDNRVMLSLSVLK